ncbi:MAG: hypothetical protein P4L50_18560 [Anaerolineaceae bacterium]|nr:hypothetical protein [Anaerolineaceae bacterium]
MNKISTRVITLFVLFSLMFANVGVIGTVPVMAQAASTQAPTAVVDQQATPENPTVETTAAPTGLPATLAAPSATPTSVPASATPTIAEPSLTPSAEAPSDTPTVATSPATATPTLETPITTATIEPTLTAAPDISASSISYNCTIQTDIPLIECQALVALYNSTGGSTWTNHADWLVTNTPCSWPGVTCSSGHVTSLNLHNNNLKGTLPIQLGNLTGLQVLDLDTNHLSGSIPTQLGNLTDLHEIVLNNNQFSGSIPTQLGNPTGMEELILNVNKLTGSIPSQLGNLTNLVVLDLGSNQLSGSIPSVLANLTALQTLGLGNNRLSGGIPSQLGNLTGLQTLDLSSNKLSGSIPAELGNLNILNWINLSSNQLTGNIPTEFGNLTQLQNLFINSNLLSGSLPVSLDNITGLHFFYFNNTSLCEPNDVSFQTWLTSIAHLIGSIHCSVSIGGAVTVGVDGLKSVKISLGTQTTTTAADGSFTITNLPYGTSGSLTPSLAGYTFSPTSIPISSLTGDLTAQNFSATQLTYTVSGKISGVVAANVNVSDGTNTNPTDQNGNYSFTEPYGANIVLTPSQAGYIFSPASIAVNNIKANQTGKNFVSSNLTLSVSGYITLGSSGLSGVSVSDGITTTSTSRYGYYVFTQIPYNSNLTITPTKTNYNFSPAPIVINNLTSNLAGRNFTAALNTFDISGKVTNSDGSGGLDGVTVSLGSHSSTTQNGGLYTILNVPVGKKGQLTAFMPGYSMTPAYITISSLAGALTDQNFVATALPTTYSISGKVTFSIPYKKGTMSVPFPGVTVYLGPYNAVTDNNGAYTIPLIEPNKSGTLSAYIYGYSFSSKYITTLNADLTGQNFSANQDIFTVYGKIYSSQHDLANVKLHITANGIPTTDGTTDSTGQYFLRNMPSDNTYTITPELAGYTFKSLNSVQYGQDHVTLNYLDGDTSQDFKGTLQYETISGNVSGLGNTAIEIRYGIGSTQKTTTDSNGFYSFKDLPQDMNYTLTPVSPLPPNSIFRFDPTSLFIKAGSGDLSAQNFTATPQVVMSGAVTAQNKPVQGVTISLAEYSFIKTTTDAHGNYSLWVPKNVSITPTATHPYYTFTDNVVANSYLSDFGLSWSKAEVIVTGNILLNGAALSGVNVSASPALGGTPASGVSDSSGYSLTVLDTNTPRLSYFIVTPVLAGYTFSPASLAVSSGGSTLKNFKAIANKWSVSGKVTSGSLGMGGVQIDISVAGVDHKLFTNSLGAYHLSGVPFDANVILTAKKYGYDFGSPISIAIMPNNDLPDQNFSANTLLLDRSITGAVTLNGTSTPLANVLVSLIYKNDLIFSTKTARDGTYSFHNLYAGKTTQDYQLTTVLSHYTFNPASPQAVDLFSLGAGGTAAQNFSATRVFTLSGRIYGLPVNTSTVDFNIGVNSNTPALTPVTVDSLGRYAFLIPNMPAGNTYTIAPIADGSLTSYTFTPAAFTFPIGPLNTLIIKNFIAVHP